MLIRYKKNEQGKSVPVADIYTPAEHGIDPALIDKDALWAVRKLKNSGEEAYIVGGAVRDLMLGLVPKDFDITTSASPRQIQRLFWNARIIGRRFKLVHLVFGGKIIECSTFRSGQTAEDGSNNVFGSVEQDAKRRDFTLNAFYYDPTNGQLLDFNHGMADFKKKLVRSIIPLDETFVEDPVRMIRAVKYTVTTGFHMGFRLRRAVRRYSSELSRVSVSRLTEEAEKIWASGRMADLLPALESYHLLSALFPHFRQALGSRDFTDSLRELDKRVMAAKKNGTEVGLDEEIALSCGGLVSFDDSLSDTERSIDLFRQIKALIAPLTPPNYEVEGAVRFLLTANGYRVPKRRRRSRPTPGPDQRRFSRRTGGAGRRGRGGKGRRGTPSVPKTTSPQPGTRDESPMPRTSAEAHDL